MYESVTEARGFLAEHPHLSDVIDPDHEPEWTDQPDDPIPLNHWLYLREQILAGQGAAQLMGLTVDDVQTPALIFALPLQLTAQQAESFKLYRDKFISWFLEYFDKIEILPETTQPEEANA